MSNFVSSSIRTPDIFPYLDAPPHNSIDRKPTQDIKYRSHHHNANELMSATCNDSVIFKLAGT